MSAAERASSLMFKPVGQRAAVAAAGPAANFLLAIVLFTAACSCASGRTVAPIHRAGDQGQSGGGGRHPDR